MVPFLWINVNMRFVNFVKRFMFLNCKWFWLKKVIFSWKNSTSAKSDFLYNLNGDGQKYNFKFRALYLRDYLSKLNVNIVLEWLFVVKYSVSCYLSSKIIFKRNVLKRGYSDALSWLPLEFPMMLRKYRFSILLGKMNTKCQEKMGINSQTWLFPLFPDRI